VRREDNVFLNNNMERAQGRERERGDGMGAEGRAVRMKQE